MRAERAESFIENWLIPFLAYAVIIAVLVVFVHAFNLSLKANNCGTVIQCRDAYVQECLALERYSRDECIRLAAGK